MRQIRRHVLQANDRASQVLIDKRWCYTCPAEVASGFRKIVTLVLLALWLPTTQHCGLEAAGLIAAEVPHGADAGCCQMGGGPCTHDGCHVVESSLIKSSNELIKGPTPSLAACTCFLCLEFLPPVVAVEPLLAVTASDSAEHWVPVWQFVRRAAPLSRAPSLVG